MKTINTGVEDFKKVIDNDYYYVDKTQLVEDVFTNEVMLYTRPRRFGKTLNMSMLYYFFSNKEKDNAYLFDGLKITKNTEMMKHQNQYPMIFMTLKDMQATSMDYQKRKFSEMISRIVIQNKELLNSDKVDEAYKAKLESLRFEKADAVTLASSLSLITECLKLHYGKNTIILIDEYDVPLQSAYMNGYYQEMVNFMKDVFSSALKTNNALERGVLTGCLRIAKESIFTGLNNFTVRSITDQYADDGFGFTQNEIDALLDYYHLSDKKEIMKMWYDGYLFGNTEIYNPWSCLKFTQELLGDKNTYPISFWANTSSNDIVRQYIEHGNQTMKEEFESLINGKSITKKIAPELTYREMNFESKEDMNDDIYSFLLFTGYLKIKNKVYKENNGKKTQEPLLNTYKLVIPNKEIRTIYEDTFNKWFDEFQRVRRNDFVSKLIKSETFEAMDLLSEVLLNNISYYDNYESFYHGFMVGFLKAEGYEVKSNKESGKGRFDIALIPNKISGTVIIIECKHSNSSDNLVTDSKKAALQINDKEYLKSYISKGYRDCIGYGISFFKKMCHITKL